MTIYDDMTQRPRHAMSGSGPVDSYDPHAPRDPNGPVGLGPSSAPDPADYGLPDEHVYGSDDPPGGPPSPLLDVPDEDAAPEPVPAETVPPAAGLVACPTCGGGVHPNRLAR